MLLSDAVNTCNGLELKRRVQQWLAQEYVASVDEVEPARMRARMQEKTFNGRVRLEACNAIWLIDGGVTDSEASEGVLQYAEKVVVSILYVIRQ